MKSRKPVTMAIALGAILTLCLYTLAVAEEDDDIIFIDNFQVGEPFSLVLNDTGIDWWADGDEHFLDESPADYPDQDADFGRDALARAGELDKVGGGAAGFDFTKLDDNGDDLPASATEWSCVRDNHTGLIWEVKVNNPTHLRHRGHTYTWYNPDDDTNGGMAGTQDGGDCTESSDCDTHAFVQAINNAELCGSSDWRMPSREELRSIVDYASTDPAIDEDYFPNTELSRFWTASPYVFSSRAWYVNLDNGNDNFRFKSRDDGVRLVRVEQ